MSGKKIAEVSFVIFILCAALGVFIMFYMHSDAQRAAEIEAYLNYKYGITVDENEGVTFNGDEFSLVTSDKITVLGTCDYFGEVQMESYVNYYYADECVAQINEKIGDCFSDCVIVYDGISLSELASFQCYKEESSRRPTGQILYKNYYNFIEAPNNDENCPIHKATYSTLLCRKLMLLYSKEGDTIYDPFMGTGTTAIACIKEKRNYIGSELSPRYVDWAEKRIWKEQRQLSLF